METRADIIAWIAKVRRGDANKEDAIRIIQNKTLLWSTVKDIESGAISPEESRILLLGGEGPPPRTIDVWHSRRRESDSDSEGGGFSGEQLFAAAVVGAMCCNLM